ncbi:ABC-type transporter, periplasmic subunit [Pseudonocardia dioxanivorans CB1190]|jgi:peptide/nickel transport system substrate-binding protein|uniref:ABC-type transporter, periplasmic subunit n=1 Tax=Pseudonocardia dioxanivorans (strain ATCC 55486 / DSM 44775 / JCM 13855 / CB1190) TaxID=675635 RepID=F4CP96_PSEUX|nr:ABC transporter substrate-binding protein [Pseudonocardia dioxanivorans]AEA23655.1 ABC-type transporter, periplasmic subunit [Pseudonocardia dioxanivorans CB1190]
MRTGSERGSRHKRIAAAIAALAAIVLVGTACGSNGGATSAAANPDHLDSSKPFGGDPAEEGTPKPGGTLIVGMYTEARSFDPVIGSNLMASAVYDSLLKMDSKGNPQPYLAQSMDTPDGGKTWVMKLRPGVTFQDGTPFNADAVIFNVKRQMDTPAALGKLYTEPIQTMTATDPLTITFVLKRPTATFPTSFALPFSSGNLGSIASPTAVQKEGADYGRNPVGAGPFQFVDWIPNNKIDVKKFDNYWDKGKPYLDAIQFRPISDTDARYASVQNGDVDLDIGGFFSELRQASMNKDLVTYYGPGGDGQYLYYNLTKKPFDDKSVRQALIMAIDPKALNATQYNNVGLLTTTPFAPDSQYFSQAAADAYPKYDPAKAKQLIDAYKAGGGNPDFTYNTGNSPDDHQLGQFLQAQWAAIGVNVKLQFDDISTFIGPIIQGTQFGTATWISGPYENPFPFMTNQFHTGGINNYGKYSNPQVDAALDEAAASTDPATQIAAYKKAQELITQDLPVVWLSQAAKAAIARPNVKGVSRYLSSELFWGGTWKS